MSPKNLTEEDLDRLVVPAKTTSVVNKTPVVPTVEKINSLVQKESAMEKVGLRRQLAYNKIVEALNATRRTEYRDAEGNVLYREEPDFEKNKWGAEMALKAFGDLVERKELEHSGSIDDGREITDWFRSQTPRTRLGVALGDG
jgi:hypothetical protein